MDPRTIVVLAGMAGAAALQGPIGESNAERRTNDFRYTPDPAVMRVVAGAHRSTLADLLWLRALPDMSRQFSDPALKKRWIAGATDVITDLEPTFGTVYGYGAAHLNLVDRNPDEAIALLEKGIAKNPDSAGLHVALAMEYYEYKKDKAKAIELLDKASKLPDIDSLSLSMLVAMKVDSRDDFMAVCYWAKALEEAPNAPVRAICEYELWRTKLLIAGRAAREFEAAHQRKPRDASELRDPKLMSESVFDVVLEGLEFDAKGRARYDRFDELTIEQRIAQAVSWVRAFREGNEGRTPTETEFMKLFGDLPDPPAGKRWRYADGTLGLVGE